MTFCVKTRLDFLSGSKFAKMANNLTLDSLRGVRAAPQSRALPDGTLSPAYMVEWMCAIQTNIQSGGRLRVQENDKVRERLLYFSTCLYAEIVRQRVLPQREPDEVERVPWH